MELNTTINQIHFDKIVIPSNMFDWLNEYGIFMFLLERLWEVTNDCLKTKKKSLQTVLSSISIMYLCMLCLYYSFIVEASI